MKQANPTTLRPRAALPGANPVRTVLIGTVLFGAVLFAGALGWAEAVAAESLGRLFFTPAQRSALDGGKRIGEPRVKRAPAPRGPRELKLDGVVTRSDGESTIWVNGRALDKRPASGRPASGISATTSSSDPAAARVKLGSARNAVQMRVGQRLERSTGKIAEPYESVAVPAEAGTTSVAQERKRAAGRKRAPAKPETLSVPSSEE